MHLISHLIDYMRWYNGESPAQWVMGQAAGQGKLSDLHPCPDYIGGFIQFANGVRASSNVVPAHWMFPRSITGGANAALARKAPRDSPRC